MGKRLQMNPFQFRRGTAVENDAYIGAEGELTYDTTAKSVRAHDGETAGGTPLAAAGHSHQSDLQPITADIAALYTALAELAEQVMSIPEATGAPPDDYIVAKSAPGANPWHRRWNSGWVEQGGTYTGSNLGTVNLPVEMADNKYQVNFSVSYTGTPALIQVVKSGSKTPTSFQMIMGGADTTNDWEVKGYAE